MVQLELNLMPNLVPKLKFNLMAKIRVNLMVKYNDYIWLLH
jgi:hypothetical protein